MRDYLGCVGIVMLPSPLCLLGMCVAVDRHISTWCMMPVL